MDRDDLIQAIEIALGDTLGGAAIDNRRVVPERNIERQITVLRRVLGELPPETSVQELIEALDE